MNFSEIELPSNRKFGLLFTAIFIIFSGYFLNEQAYRTASIFSGLSAIFLATSLLKEELLLPLNKLWMRFGLLLGMIVSPIVLGLIFFGLFTPIALGMRLFGRDELRLKLKRYETFWKLRQSVEKHSDTFRNQF